MSHFIQISFHSGCLPFWSSSILVVFRFGRLPLWLSSALVVFHFGRLPLRSSSILVIFSFGSHSFWLSSILVVFHFARLPFWSSRWPTQLKTVCIQLNYWYLMLEFFCADFQLDHYYSGWVVGLDKLKKRLTQFNCNCNYQLEPGVNILRKAGALAPTYFLLNERFR